MNNTHATTPIFPSTAVHPISGGTAPETLPTTDFLALAIKKTEDYRAANIPMLPVVYGFEVTKRQIIVWVACLMPLPFFLGNI